MTRTRTAAQAFNDSILKALEYLTTSSDEREPRTNIAAPVGEVPNPPSLNEAIRAAAKRTDEPMAAGADVHGVAPAPSLNASIMKFLKKGFAR